MSPPSDHPSKQNLLEYLKLQDSPEEEARVREHLAERCLRCVRELHFLIPQSHPWLSEGEIHLFEGTEEQKRATFHRIAHRADRVAAVLRVEDELAPELFGQLLKLSPEDRRKTIQETPTFGFLGLAEYVVERSREKGFEDPSQAEELAELAVEVSEALSREIYPSTMVLDAQTLAWAALGNARRLRSDLVGADRAFGPAQRLLKRSKAKDPWNRGEVLSLLASLRIDQTRFDEARKLLEEAVEIFRKGQETEREAKALIQLGKTASDAGAPEEAIPFLESARELLGDEDARLRMMAGHTLAMALLEAGRREESQGLFERLAPEYDAHAGEFWTEQRRTWLAGRLAQARGDVAEAEGFYQAIRDGFLEREMAYDYALSTLEHAGLLLEQGRHAEVRRLAEELVPLFVSHQLHRHALAALSIFQQAAAAQEATSELVRDVLAYLRRARNNPKLAYRGEAPR
ncbi:MAG TPA: tetratricopeptide repeat protein [Thermoanaerobaculia bacterium]|nr:tetratricopeptide repeat protein [Thermoanaerobaculia bacterium]